MNSCIQAQSSAAPRGPVCRQQGPVLIAGPKHQNQQESGSWYRHSPAQSLNRIHTTQWARERSGTPQAGLQTHQLESWSKKKPYLVSRRTALFWWLLMATQHGCAQLETYASPAELREGKPPSNWAQMVSRPWVWVGGSGEAGHLDGAQGSGNFPPGHAEVDPLPPSAGESIH